MILIIVFILTLLYSYYRSQCTKKNPMTIPTLVRQTARWMIAARQDQNPLIAVMHANYATGYWYALRDIATDQAIERATGLDAVVFQRQVQAVQEEATMKALQVCPSFGPQTDLARLAGEGIV